MQSAKQKNKLEFLKDVSAQWNKNMDALVNDKDLLKIANLSEKATL